MKSFEDIIKFKKLQGRRSKTKKIISSTNFKNITPLKLERVIKMKPFQFGKGRQIGMHLKRNIIEISNEQYSDADYEIDFMEDNFVDQIEVVEDNIPDPIEKDIEIDFPNEDMAETFITEDLNELAFDNYLFGAKLIQGGDKTVIKLFIIDCK